MLTGVTGIVLAGGQSTRMKRDKALLPLDGIPLAMRVANRLRASVDELVVVGHAGNVGALRDLPLGAADIVEDLAPDQGPLMGVYTGLMRAKTPRSICVPCDMPYVQPELVDRLIAACGTLADVVGSEVPGDGETSAAVPHPVREIHPFPLAVHARCAASVGALLDAGRRSLRDLVCGPHGRLLVIEDPLLVLSFTNFNSPADLPKERRNAVAR